MTQARPYRGVGADDRRAARRAVLIETALDCLDDDGLSGVSVRSICSRARLTPRYFYENFADLDELLVAVVDSVAAEVAANGIAAVTAAPADLHAQVRALVDAAYGVVADDRRKAHAILVAASGHGPLRDRREQILIDYANIALGNLPVLGAMTALDRRRGVGTALFLMGGTFELIAAVLSGTLRLSRSRVVDMLTELWTSVLAEAGQ